MTPGLIPTGPVTPPAPVGLHVVEGSVKPETHANYATAVRCHIVPSIGARKLAKLSPVDVKGMLRDLDRKGLAPRTQRYARAVLRRALRHAEQYGLVVRNVAALVDGPKGSSTKTDDALDAAQAAAVLAKAAGTRYEALAVLVLRLGLRKGEALGLKWADIDLDARTLEVRGALRRRKGVGLVLDDPKAGQRPHHPPRRHHDHGPDLTSTPAGR
jgi:integrase